MARREHWDEVYRRRQPQQLSWYSPHLESSLQLIARALPRGEGCLIDVGGGSSTLVDDLLARGYRDLEVLDVSAAALERARERLGPRGGAVRWRRADVTRAQLPAGAYDLWHDRALFHFLTEITERSAYLRQLRHALKPHGCVILATFAEDGPASCSGLPVRRYSAETLALELGSGFSLEDTLTQRHLTPGGVAQPFVYACFRAR
ncbi:MAG: class I SAM-dependent methyltransferase [Gammaproteobacteria bacterium]|nr:class I SAM-dependent methyltransferase [Gammaproteobacteria bacterium]MBV9621505.1 class I SAM-dependent methyltransferase [Gammaproteobacteria bacterium]